MSARYPRQTLAETIQLQDRPIAVAAPPDALVVREDLGLIAAPAVDGQIVYRTERGTLFETRAIKTPGGDYLLMFPTNTVTVPDGRCHYGRQDRKVNDLVAFRSSDRGATWHGPSRPIDIDYNLHGFIPLMPRAGSGVPEGRIYCFGTQPIWSLHTIERGLHENAPIGFRYSDDDGHTWSEVRLIRPTKDPDFTGMSVMRMCETEAGTWLLGSHEGDWSYRPLMTRQYILRSEDQGQSWELLPDARHGGWHAGGFNRMDELRPIDLGNGEVYAMARTPEGHLWNLRSHDNGLTWSEPKPTSLVHPDAPPMLFMLSNGDLAAFHHNRHHDLDYTGLSGDKEALMGDRSEIWVAISQDGGRTWGEPRFVFANALAPAYEMPFMNHQCSYIDAFVDDGVANLFVPHRWHQMLHLRIPEAALQELPTAEELF